MIDAVEASGTHRQPPSVELEIDFDLQLSPSFSDEYQKHDQHQDDHI